MSEAPAPKASPRRVRTPQRDASLARRVQQRADELLPEEQQAGSDDPVAQAREILLESEERTLQRDDPTKPGIERRHSEDTVDPDPGALDLP